MKNIKLEWLLNLDNLQTLSDETVFLFQKESIFFEMSGWFRLIQDNPQLSKENFAVSFTNSEIKKVFVFILDKNNMEEFKILLNSCCEIVGREKGSSIEIDDRDTTDKRIVIPSYILPWNGKIIL